MSGERDFLVEIGTEELPPKALPALAAAFTAGLSAGLEKAGLKHGAVRSFATPRRLALLVKHLAAQQPEQTLKRRGPPLSAAFDGVKSRFLVISFSSDWLYPSYQSLDIVRALRGRNCDVAYCDLPSTYGHDAFLVNVSEQAELVRGFLASTFRERS